MVFFWLTVRSLLVPAALGQRAVWTSLFHFHNASACAAGKHTGMLLFSCTHGKMEGWTGRERNREREKDGKKFEGSKDRKSQREREGWVVALHLKTNTETERRHISFALKSTLTVQETISVNVLEPFFSWTGADV